MLGRLAPEGLPPLASIRALITRYRPVLAILAAILLLSLLVEGPRPAEPPDPPRPAISTPAP